MLVRQLKTTALRTVCVVCVWPIDQRLRVVQALLHVLCRLLEDNLFVRLGHQTLFSGWRSHRFSAIDDWRLEQLQNVVQCNGPLGWIVEMQFDHHLELSPSGFGDFIRRLGKHTIRVRITFVQLEMDLFHPRRHVLVVVRFHIDRPLMCVAVFLALFAKRPRYIAINNWLDNGQALEYRELRWFFLLCTANRSRHIEFTLTRPPESGP